MEHTTKGEPFKSKTGAIKTRQTMEVGLIDFISRILNPRVAESEFGWSLYTGFTVLMDDKCIKLFQAQPSALSEVSVQILV